MFAYGSFDNVTKACVLTLLLTLSMVVHAQPSDASAGAQEQGAAAASAGRQQRAYFFPGWPKQSKAKQERVPPPPPGPYMSTALSGSSVAGPSFADDTQAAKMTDPAVAEMEKFSPDIAWPSSGNEHSAHRWKPENGYKYVRPRVEKQPYRAMPHHYGYEYPVMYWPGRSHTANPGYYAPRSQPVNRVPYPSAGR